MTLQDIIKLYDFTGHTAVITGGAGVLGGEMAQALVACGAKVAILDVKQPDASLSRRLEEYPGQTMFFQASVLDRNRLVEAEQAISARFGTVDMLLNVAGGHHPQATTSPSLSFFDLPEDALRSVLDLNLMGTILPTQVFARKMAERGEGAILNISSVSAFHSLTRVIAYSAAKAAVNTFTQWLAVHLAQEYSPRLRVNAIAPGFYLTNANRSLLIDAETGELTGRSRSIVGNTPLGRFGDPGELLSTVLWLLSPASSYVTGVVVPVDGGFSAFSGV